MQPQTRYHPGDKIGGRYQVHQALMGGMGEVYFCLDLKELYPYVLKTFQTRFATNLKLRKAFEREVATWIALEKHPNIVRCFYMDIVDNQPFMLLEWIASDESQGTDLRSWLWRGPLDLRLALDFTIDICRGLIHAQQKQPGIVHCDLKPENILIAQGRIAKVTDFGLARVVQKADLEHIDIKPPRGERQSLVGIGGVVGTPPYMAPEQWRAEEPDQRTDIYALGCILYETLAGCMPFTATTLDEYRHQHLEAAIPLLNSKGTISSASALDTILARCLAKCREERFSQVDELLYELSKVYQQQFEDIPKTRDRGNLSAVELNNRGTTYHRLQCYDKALEDLNAATQLNPTWAPAYSNRANAHHALGQYEQAVANYSRAIQIDPTCAVFFCNRGDTYTSLEQWDKALADFAKAIELDPTYPLTYNNRANTLVGLKRYDEALVDLNHAVQLGPLFALSYANRGLVYSIQQQYDKAFADYAHAIELDPVLVRSYKLRGIDYFQLQYYEEALTDFCVAIQLDPTDKSMYRFRAETYMALNHYDEALADFTEVIRAEPKDIVALANRGRAYAQLNRYDEALADLNQVIQIDPTNVSAYNARALIYAELKRFDTAMIDLHRAIRLDPNEASVYTSRGMVYTALQQYNEALADFTKAVQLDPDDATNYYRRARVYEMLQLYDETLSDLAHAIERDPNSADCYNDRGILLTRLGRYDGALADLSRAIQLDPTDADINFNIGAIKGIIGMQQWGESSTDFGVLQSAAANMLQATTYFEKALELGQSKAEEWIERLNIHLQTLGVHLNNTGYQLLQAGQCDEALELLQESVKVCRQVDDQDGEITALENSYLALRAVQRYKEALRALGAILDSLMRFGRVKEYLSCVSEAIQATETLEQLGHICVIRKNHYDTDLQTCIEKYGSSVKIVIVEDAQDILEVMAHIPEEERRAFLNTAIEEMERPTC